MSKVRDPLPRDGLDLPGRDPGRAATPGAFRTDVPPGTLALVNSSLFADASNFELRFVPDYQRITAIVQALRPKMTRNSGYMRTIGADAKAAIQVSQAARTSRTR